MALREPSSFARRYANRLTATYLAIVLGLFWGCHLVLPLVGLADANVVPVLLGKMAVIVVASALYMKFRLLRWVAQYERVNEALRQSHFELVERLACAAEYRDDGLGVHNHRIGRFAQIVGRRLGLTEEKCDLMYYASALHDIGKIAVPDAILLKPGRLTDSERESMNRHVAVGAALLSDSEDPLIAMAYRIAHDHHENWDGTGYPCHIRGEGITLEGRIVAVCDVFDALISDRPYKKAWSASEAFAELRLLSGSKFDPNVVDAFLASESEILEVLSHTRPGPWVRFRDNEEACSTLEDRASHVSA